MHGFLHILAQKCTILVNFPENLSYFISKTQKTLCFCNFPGARSNRSNPISYSFYLIGLLWSGDLEKHPNCKTVSRLDLVCLCPKWKTLACSTCLQCCPLHSLERDHTHLWSNIESKVQNELKMHGFLHILAQKCTILVNFPENLSYFISKTQKTLCFCNFPGARSNRSNPITYSFYLIGLLWSGDLEKHPNCKTVSRLDLVCLCPKWKTLVVLNLPCNAAHCTVEGIILICGQTLSQKFKTIWKRMVFAHFGTKVHNSCQFRGEFIILYQQNSENPVFLQFSRGSFK